MLTYILKHRSLIREVFLYGLIGVVAATIDSVIFYFLHKIINIYLSNFISVNIGITISFLLNAYFNFRVTDKLLKRALSFFSVGYTGLLLSMLILFIGVDLLNFPEMPVKIFSVFAVAAFQFVINKLITFRRTS